MPWGMALGGERELQHCSQPVSSPVLHVLVGPWHLYSYFLSSPGVPDHPM